MRLADGAHVVVVGGGPAGSLTAIQLLDRMRTGAGPRLRVSLYEAADFDRVGQPGCNKCAGILSSTLVRKLEGAGLRLPPDVIQSEIDSYVLHLGSLSLPVSRIDPERRIYSVFRGRGPREGTAPYPRSFDAWLLDEARLRGAEIKRGRVNRVLRGERPRVLVAGETVEPELVVVATGINSRAPLDPSWHYVPPRAETMAQDEFALPPGVDERVVHVYFDHPPGLVFGAVIPKGRYANVSLLGRALAPDAVSDFITGHGLTQLRAEGRAGLCGCAPRVAVSAARGYFADRLVVTGDAAVTRLYKDGLGAAAVTAEAAARCALERGVAGRDFALGYAPTCRRIAADRAYGRLCFRLWELTRRTPLLLRSWQQAIKVEESLPPDARMHARVLWGMFTGDMSYRRLFWLSVSPRALMALARGYARARRA